MANYDPGMSLFRAGVLCQFVFAAAVGSAAAGEWATAPQMSTAQSEIAAAVVGDRIYVGGGLTLFGTTATFEAFDPRSESWEELPAMPETLHHLGMAGLAGRIYVTGGYDSIAFDPDRTAMFSYDPQTRRWREEPPMPLPRAAHAMAALDGKLFVVGGVGPEHRKMQVFDPQTGIWDTSRAPLPTAREHLSAAVLGGELYVVGGRGFGAGNRSTLEIYDPVTDRWRGAADMPTPRGGLAAGALDGRLHVTGGEAFSPGWTFAAHEVYDPETDTWSTQADMPTPRHGLTSAIVGSRWYVVGGGEEAGARTVISLTDAVEAYDVSN
ncbi:MAG: galactose oxidase [Alphaproteobacteria bacterium]|nr:galactose oxidase [Alphaproteobacteria bacterium]